MGALFPFLVMNHSFHRIDAVRAREPYTLWVRFGDGIEQVIDLEPVLEGQIYGPLRDPALFAQATVDPEVHTVVWPNGADFDPAILHDWPDHAMAALARKWTKVSA